MKIVNINEKFLFLSKKKLYSLQDFTSLSLKKKLSIKIDE